MIHAPTQPVTLCLSDRLRERLRTLGVTVLRITADGHAAPQGGCHWIEQVIVRSPQFIASLRRQWLELDARRGQVVPVWPGVSLVPLPVGRRRRLAVNKEQMELLAVLLLGPDVLEADQLRLVCDTSHLDYRAAMAKVDPHHLVTDPEAQRLAATLAWMHADATEIDRRMGELQSLSGELAESYEELSLLYKLSSSMTVNQPPETFLVEACHELQQVVALRWMGLLLVDEPRLEELAGETFTAGPVGCEGGELARIGRELMQRLDGTPHPLVVDDTATLGIDGLDRLARSLLIIPLCAERQPLGLLIGGDKLDGTHISSVDSKLCNSLANSLSIFLENRMLYDDMQAMFLGTLHALTSAIDAKDSYTHGHSERVALMSRRLAEAAGLDEPTCERVYIAGLVHDVGKIGVPERVLCKPGRLTDEEFALIKMHPEIGARILQDIRQMQDLIPGVLHHHERWDGRGYPHKLAAMDIPLFGRLIGLADAFDAMSSDRTYRRAMPPEEVLAEVRRCAGAQFDPELAKRFVELDFSEYAQLIEKHQGHQMRQSA